MTRTPSFVVRTVSSIATFALALAGLSVLAIAPAAAANTPVYDSIPAVSPPTYLSQAFEATQTDEFGSYVQLGGTDRVISDVTVGLTDWACQNWEAMAVAAADCVTTPDSSFPQDITLNLYEVDNSGALPKPGAIIATVTEEKSIPFRPSANEAECGVDDPRWYNADTDSCQNGFAFNVNFDLTGENVVVGTDVIVGIAYNTQHYGAEPTGVPGPVDSLNVSIADAAPTVGNQENPDEMLIDSTWGGNYSDGGAGGLDTLRTDTGWTGYYGLVLRINADPELVADPTNDVTVYQKDVKPTENSSTYQQWHEGNSTPAYSVQPDGLHLGVGGKSTIIKGTDVANSVISKAALRALIIAGASANVVDASNPALLPTFQVPVAFGTALTPGNYTFTTLHTSLNEGPNTFSLGQDWRTSKAFGAYLVQGTDSLGDFLDAIYAGGNTVWLFGFGVQADAASIINEVVWDGTRYTFFQPIIEACTLPLDTAAATNLDPDGWSLKPAREADGTAAWVDGGLSLDASDNTGSAWAIKTLPAGTHLSQIGDLTTNFVSKSGIYWGGIILEGGDLTHQLHYDDNGRFWTEQAGIFGQDRAGYYQSFPIVDGADVVDLTPDILSDPIIGSIKIYVNSGQSAVVMSQSYACGSELFDLQYVTPTVCPVATELPASTNLDNKGWVTKGDAEYVEGGIELTSSDWESAYVSKDVNFPLSEAANLDLDTSGGDIWAILLETSAGQIHWEPSYTDDLWMDEAGVLPRNAVNAGDNAGQGGPFSGSLNTLLSDPTVTQVKLYHVSGSTEPVTGVLHTGFFNCLEQPFDFVTPSIVPGAPTISGTPTVGQTLTANTGTWAPPGVTFTYQWKADGTEIDGATASTYVLTAAEFDKTIVVVVTGHLTGYADKAATSPGTTDVAAGPLTPATPTIAGTVAFGSTLAAVPGAWGPAPVALSYQWYANGVLVPDATANTYLITYADAGKSLSVKVTGSKTGYATASATSAPTITLPSDVTPVVDRIAGPNRFSTAVKISQGFAPGVDRVYLASGLGFPDALSAAPAAAHFGVPLLLTLPNGLPNEVITELERLHPDEIVVVGSNATVGDVVVDQLEALGFHPDVLRLGGVDRFETSRLIAAEAFPSATTAYVASGLNFPDALSAAPAAASFDGPVLLVQGLAGSVDNATLDLFDDLNVSTIKIAGSSLSVSTGIETQLDALYTVKRNGGINRFFTAIEINEDEFESASTIYLASGLNFPDALAGAARAGHEGAPMFISTVECIPPAVLESIIGLDPARIVLLGSTPSLSLAVEELEVCS